MFLVAIGIVMGAPHIINGFNRILEELVIPRMDMRKLQERRASQAAVGIEESKREVFRRVQFIVDGQELIDAELTVDEFGQLNKIGAVHILVRGANRRPHVRKIEENKEAS